MFINNISANVIDIIKTVPYTDYRVIKSYINGKIDIVIMGAPCQLDIIREKIWG